MEPPQDADSNPLVCPTLAGVSTGMNEQDVILYGLWLTLSNNDAIERLVQGTPMII